MKIKIKSFLIFSILFIFSLTFANCKPRSFNKSGFAGKSNLLEAYQAEINELQIFLNVDKASYLASVHMQNLNRNAGQNTDASKFYLAMTPSFFHQKFSSDPAIQDSNLLPDFLRKREKEAGGTGHSNGVLEKELADFSSAFSIKNRGEMNQIPALAAELIEPEDSSFISVPQLPTGELETQYALNIQDYVANRMTRGVFWDVNHSDRDIEFHVGLYREFFDRVAAKGGIIIGEVKTAAANYNKIYILKYPDKNHLTYAVAPISGQDRLNHLLYHLAVAQASLPGPSADAKVVQYGQTNSYLERSEKDFILWLKRRPKADVTLIGQKVGLEKIFTEMASKNKVAINFKSGEFSSSMFDAADLSYKNKNGKTGLIRVISNVWGDEIRPIAQALSATGHQKILYIGTAGALPHSNYAVGDLLVAKTFISADMHTVINFPSSFSVIPQTSIVKNDAIIGGVISPLLENQKWAQQFAAKGAHGVEVETFHLAKALKEKAQLSVLLMVSDVLFSKHTLDAMDPSMRSEAKNIAFQVLFKEAGIENVAESPAPPENSLEKTMQQIFPPKTSAVYRHFALQTARQNFAGRAPANNLQNILRYWNHFTEKDIEEVILPVSELAMIIKQTAELKNKIFISVPQTFLKGTWHPKKDDLQINFIAIDSNSQKKLNSIIENWQAKSKIRNVAAKSSLSNIETISAMNGNTENKTFALEKFKANRFSFHELYAAGAYMYSGMMQTETSIGEWKFIDSGTSTELKSCPIELFICTL